MCHLNKPLECTDCSINVCATHFSSGNIANCITRVIKDKRKLLPILTPLKIQIEKENKECGSVLSSICYHPDEQEILQTLSFIKSCGVRFDKWYMHYAILNKKWEVIVYLKKHNCPLRCQHLQSAITVENYDLIEEICVKHNYTFTEKNQKMITDALMGCKCLKTIKLLLPYFYPPTLRQLTLLCQNKKYLLLYHSLQKIGLHLTPQSSAKCLELLNNNIMSSLNTNRKEKEFGMHVNADRLSSSPENNIYFSKCVDWLELSPAKRYVHFIQERNKILQIVLDSKICRDEQSVILQFL